MTTEMSKSQIITSFGPTLTNPLPVSYDTYRTMRKHPTIALARALVSAPILASSWSVESDADVPEERVEFVRKQIIPIREQVLESALDGGMDFGWAPFEKVLDLDGKRIVLKKLKALLHDITEIQVIQGTGAFAGFKQHEIVIPLEFSFNIPFRVEGTQWHGQSLMENARGTYNQWVEANAGAARYDKKVAGSHFVVYYPLGTSPVNGIEKANSEVAADILKALESSGTITVPRTVAEFVDELKNEDLGWKIDILEDAGGRQPTFIDRLKYLDVLLVRSFLMPERGVLEGQYGTKAEAGVHIDLAITRMELTHKHIVRHLNWHVIDQLLVFNWGEDARGTVRIEAAPLVDEALSYLRELYAAVLKNPSGFLEEFGAIDTNALKERLSVPIGDEDREILPLPGVEKPHAGD